MNKIFTDNGWQDYVYWQTEDRKTLKKINSLLEDIARNSTIMTERDVDTNFYSSLTASDAGDYGDILDLNVYMTIHPSFAYYNPKRTATDMTWLKKGTPLDITLKYEYKVPCLRYLK